MECSSSWKVRQRKPTTSGNKDSNHNLFIFYLSLPLRTNRLHSTETRPREYTVIIKSVKASLSLSGTWTFSDRLGH